MAARPTSQMMIEQRVFEAVYSRVQREKQLSSADQALLSRIFHDRFTNALEAYTKDKVHKYVFTPSNRVLWAVLGKTQEYQILPSAPFCACNDFYFRVVNREIYLCYHLLAFHLADALQRYIVITRTDRQYDAIMDRLRTPSAEHRRLSSREIENIRQTIVTLLRATNHGSARELITEIQRYGFEVLSPQHLGTILSKDKKDRFKAHGGKWYLHKE